MILLISSQQYLIINQSDSAEKFNPYLIRGKKRANFSWIIFISPVPTYIN